MIYKNLMLEQLDNKLEHWNFVKHQTFPPKGWINLLRTTLGLSSYQLAKRAGISQTRVIQIEQGEIEGSTTLNTLENTANAMGCHLVYGIVPKTTLQEILKKQAYALAKKRIKSVSHSMELEAQGINASKQQKQLERLINDLLAGPAKNIWKDE